MAYARLDQIASLLRLSERRINQLVKDEGFPRISRGQYDVMACVHWMLDHHEREIAQLKSGGESMRDAELRERKAIASMKEMELERRRGETLMRNEVMPQIEPYLKAFRESLLALPRKAAPQLQALDKITEKEEFLRDRVYEILHELARLQIRARGGSQLSPAVDASGASAPGTTAKASRKRMGRHTKKAQLRVKR